MNQLLYDLDPGQPLDYDDCFAEESLMWMEALMAGWCLLRSGCSEQLDMM